MPKAREALVRVDFGPRDPCRRDKPRWCMPRA
jgi:hypothetical protein